MITYKTLETPRLILKLFDVNDADFLLELYNTPKFIQYIGYRNIKTKDDAVAYIQGRFFPQIKKLGFGNYVIISKENNKKIGAVGIFERPNLAVMDIGFSLLPDFEKKGFAYEACYKILNTGFNIFNLEKIAALTLEENQSSRNLIVKLGLKYKKKTPLINDPEQLLYYEISKEELKTF